MTAPIHALHDELIYTIFSFLAIDNSPRRIPSIGGSKYDLGWIKATYVCRPWRQIALAASVLWSDMIVFVLGPIWASEMMVRVLEVSTSDNRMKLSMPQALCPLSYPTMRPMFSESILIALITVRYSRT